MKKVSKSKPSQTLKISSFFTKKTTDKDKTKVNSNKINGDVILIEDDEETVNTGDKILNPLTNINFQSPNSKKRKLTLTNSPQKKRPNNDFIEDLIENTKPSTSDCPTTPSKQVYPKNADKLLTPTALKEYLTPEKNPFKKSSPASRKLVFNPDDYIVKNTTPGSNTKQNSERTPSKGKKTPKKLFEISPDKIHEFNVQVMENFVKITPSKSSQKIIENGPVRKSTEKQCSIVNFFSPQISRKSMEAQTQNEKTPTKKSTAPEAQNDIVMKAKARLNFTEPSSSKVNATNGFKSPTEKFESHKVNGKISPTKSSFNSQENFDFDDNWDEDFSVEDEEVYRLDLTESQHCRVVKIDRQSSRIVLILESTKTREKARCNLEGFWLYVIVNINDVVHVSAVPGSNSDWLVDCDRGLLVYEPDHLVSTTSVVNSVFCKRKSVLSERFHGFEPTNHFMILGTLVHDLLQIVLKKKIRTVEDIQKISRDLVNNDTTIRRLYECGMSESDCNDEIQKFVPKIAEFIETYVETKSLSVGVKNYKKDDWKGTIKSIEDIEDNLWCPELGVKGKIDVSVKSGSHLMPLELKTGRATVSLEHRGQVMLYIMMLNKMGYEVPSGLLLYLKEGVLREIPMTHKEKRDIIMLRNELTYYLTRQPRIEDDGKRLIPPELPEPINHRACQNCPYNVICTSYIRYNKEDISSNKILKKIQEEALSHISDNHLNYFMHWNSLLAIEGSTKKGSKELREIFTLKPEERQSKGRCIINLKITNVGEEVNGMYEHTFECGTPQTINLMACGIAENKYVVVSLDTRPAVAAGFVNYIDAKTITVLLDRNLKIKYVDKLFHLDTYDSSSIQTYNMASLTLLFELTPRAEQLRNFIIDQKLPTFDSKLPKIIATKGTPILKRLNRVQQRAVLKAIAAKDYMLIKGMPGTGKTTTIVALIQLLTELGKSVIITSHTHSAVDNVCTRLITFGVKLMRLGAESRIHPSLKQYSEHYLTKNCKSPEELEKVYNSQLVLAVTCLGSGHPVLSKRIVDYCIVDESTQVLQSSVIRPIYASKTFILIGDPDQLPAVIQNEEAIKLGMKESIFDRLNSEEATMTLNINFRMNKPITDLANWLTYNGQLEVGSDAIANATLKIPEKMKLLEEFKTEKWLLHSIDNSLGNAVQLLNTGAVWKLNHEVRWNIISNGEDNNANVYEAAIVVRIVDALLKGGVQAEKIGVIATFRSQVALISSVLSNVNKLDVSTVDQYQGKDKNVIIYSCGKSKNVDSIKDVNKEFEVLEDKKRLNVAITRAKNKLLIIGDLLTLQEYSTFKKLIPGLKGKIYHLMEDEGFNWESILSLDNVKAIKLPESQ